MTVRAEEVALLGFDEQPCRRPVEAADTELLGARIAVVELEGRGAG